MLALPLRSLFVSFCILALPFLGSPAATAQQVPAYQQTSAAALPSDSVAWVPASLATLSRQASTRSDFSFDRSILGLVGNLSTLDAPTRQAIARLNGVSLHLYRFPASSGYDPATVQGIRAEYDALGWKHFSTSKPEPGLSGEAAGHTDVWLNTHGVDVAGAVILLAGASTVNLIAVSGDLSTLDLLHLRGHFGIPQFPADALPH